MFSLSITALGTPIHCPRMDESPSADREKTAKRGAERGESVNGVFTPMTHSSLRRAHSCISGRVNSAQRTRGEISLALVLLTLQFYHGGQVEFAALPAV